jgi:ADP-ribose pyrophosphatase YjhB (NUDIX family)
VVLQEDRLLIVKHLNHTLGCVYWWLPGGGLESGETPEACVIREIREETGLEVRLERLLFETHDPGRTYTYERYLTFLCTPIGGSPAGVAGSESSQTHSIAGLGWYPLWDEAGWESGFYEEHLLPILRMTQAALVGFSNKNPQIHTGDCTAKTRNHR